MKFDADVRHKLEGVGREIADDEPVLVYLEKMIIDTKQFCSKDTRKEREGVVTLDVAGQTTSFPYRGEGEAVSPNGKFLNKVVYLGGNPGCLGIGISLIESDAKTRNVLNTAATWTDRLSKVPLLTATHPAVGPGLGLLSSITRFVKSKVDDDCEAQAFCVFDGKLKHEGQITVTFSRLPGAKALLEVVFKVVGLNKMSSKLNRISVRVIKPELTFDQKTKIRTENIVEPSSGMVTGIKYEQVPVENWFTDKAINIFNFDASSGKSTYSYKNASGDVKPAAKQGIIAWDKNEIFTVKAADAETGTNKLLPLSLAFSLNPEVLDTEGILDLLKQGTALTSVLMPESDNVSKVLTKQAPNVLNFLSEITSDSLSLYSFNGLVVLSDENAPLPVAKDRGVLFAKKDANDPKKWNAPVDNVITWHDKPIGKFSFILELASV